MFLSTYFSKRSHVVVHVDPRCHCYTNCFIHVLFTCAKAITLRLALKTTSTLLFFRISIIFKQENLNK